MMSHLRRNKIIASGFRQMGRFKLRTFFMMLGIIVGIAALTLVLSLGKGTKQQLMGKVQRLFSANNILIAAGGGEERGGAAATGPTTTLMPDDLEALKAQIPNIRQYDAQQLALNRSVKYKQNSLDVLIRGNTPAGERVWNRSVSSGSYFDEAHMQSSARVALVGTVVRDKLFDGNDPVGEQIRIGNVPFRVIGVLEPFGVDPHGNDRDFEIAIPLSTMMRRVMNVDYIMSAKLELADEALMDRTVAQIRQVLRERHHIQPDEYDDFTMLTPEKVEQIISKMNNVFSLVLPLITAISLLAGGIVVAALMLIAIDERKSEIGLRKALGARARDISLQFMAETLAVTVTGGLIGFVLGTIGTQLVTIKMKLPPVLPWEAFLLGFVFSVIVGMAASIIPARRAAKMQPVDALT